MEPWRRARIEAALTRVQPESGLRGELVTEHGLSHLVLTGPAGMVWLLPASPHGWFLRQAIQRVERIKTDDPVAAYRQATGMASAC